MTYDVSSIDIGKLGLQAACQQAYEDGLRAGGECAFCTGMQAGYAEALMACDQAGTVTNAWFNGDHTILLFADGTKEKVKWHREPGSVDDREKAIMACILKHVLGNGYISALETFGKAPAAEPEPDMSPIVLEDSDYEDGCAPVCVPVHCGDQDELDEMFRAMPEEPGFGDGLFTE